MEIGGKNSAKFLHIRRKQSDNLIRLASVRAEVAAVAADQPSKWK